MKYKILVLDVDGTLLNDQKEISPGNLAALLKVQQMGIKVILASGRSTHGLLPIARKLELSLYGGYIMSYNGGEVIDMKAERVITSKTLKPEVLSYVYKKASKQQLPVFTYSDTNIFASDVCDSHIQHEADINGMTIIHAANFEEEIDFAPHKCIVVDNDETRLASIASNWRKHLNGVADVYISEPFFLEIVPPAVNKGDALAYLLHQLEIPAEQVIAIGDGACDIPMIQLAGLGIAMGNASDAVKSCADQYTLSNNEDGVANAIENAIFAEIRTSSIPLKELNDRSKNTLMGNLGIQYTFASLDRVEATMPVDKRTRQPFGVLHGGASLALAETIAGVGSMIIAKPDEIVVGMQVSGNHLSSAPEGSTVRAVAGIIHQGRSSHVWDVNIYTDTDKLVSSVRVINCILKKK